MAGFEIQPRYKAGVRAPKIPSANPGWVVILVLAAFLTLPLSSRSASAPITPDDSDYLVDAWTTEDGLPQSSILSMAQTRDGYLWLGTFNGLARFDGLRFAVFNQVNTPTLRSPRITGVYVDKNGWLWIVSEDGFLTRLAEGRFEAMNGKWGLPQGPLAPRGLDPDGNIWVQDAPDRFWRLAGDRFVPGNTVALAAADLHQATASSRSAWLRLEGEWRQTFGNSFPERVNEAFRTSERWLTVTARDGDVWLVGNEAVGKLRAGRMTPLPGGVSISEHTDAVEDGEGNLLIGTWTQGVLLHSRTGSLESIPLQGGNAARAVRTMMVDREGNSWVGTDLAGLQRLKRKTFHPYGGAGDRNGGAILSVTQDGIGRIWRVTGEGLEIDEAGGRFASVPAVPGVWWSVTTARDGRVWAGSASRGLCRFEGTNAGPIRPLDGIRFLAPALDGGVWVGAENGVWRATDDSLVAEDLPASLRTRDARAVLEEKENLWVGIFGDGVWRKTRGSWERFGVERGLGDLRVISLLADTDGKIWVGTVSGGLYRLKDGVFKSFDLPDSGLPATVSCLVEDDLHYLWLGSPSGICRMARRELDEFADGARPDFTVRRYGRGDGLETTEVLGTTICKTRDGRLWFATLNGLSVVDPRSITSNPVPPPVIIEEVLVNGAPSGLRQGGVLVVPPLSQRVEIRYTGVSLKAGSRVRFKRRLEGLEASWVEVGNERVATYYNLPPGSYRFHLLAANEDGVWSPREAGLSLRVLPSWWQSLWFRAGLWAVLAGLAAAAGWFRVRRVARAQAAREAFSQQLIESQEQERRRISAELHDGLGQTLLIVKHQASLAARGPGIPPESAAQMRRVSDSTQAAIEEVRVIVSALHPAMLDSIGLNGALSSMLQQAEQAGEMKLTWKVGDMKGAIAPARQIELFRVVQEALNNVVKHSRAASARVDLRREGARWILEIEDDGCGFEVGGVGQGGFGLRGMRERVRILGGVLTIESRRGHGTLLRAEAPVTLPHER